MALVIKKYSNRRLYDTEESRYITLEELTERVRAGSDVRVVDAKTNEDLTQATLTQIILEGPAARLLPVPLLTQLIRMQDDALADFLGKYVSGALEMYLTAKQGAQAVSPYFPFASMPFAASNAFARLFTQQPTWEPPREAPVAPPPPPPKPRAEPSAAESDVALLRRELEELKRSLKRKPRRRA